MSNKQRAKIYRQAAEMIANKISHSYGICLHLQNVYTEHFIWLSDVTKYFPEFSLLEPHSHKTMWWSKGKRGNEQRVIALLLSEQMALNP